MWRRGHTGRQEADPARLRQSSPRHAPQRPAPGAPYCHLMYFTLCSFTRPLDTSRAMGYLLQKLQHKDVWERILRERLTEPLHLNCLSLLVWALGSYRAKIAFDLVVRQWNAYGILKAADHAKALGIRRASGAEFGVAAGAGRLNMAGIARRVTRMTRRQIRLYGLAPDRRQPAPTD